MKPLLLLVCSCYACAAVYSQQIDSLNHVWNIIYSNYINKVDKKVLGLSNNIDKKNLEILQSLQKQEQKLQKKLALKDSVAAKALFAQNKYAQLQAKLKNPAAATRLKEYIPHFDSLQTSLKFLKDTSALCTKLPAGYADKIKSVNLHTTALEIKLQQANEIKACIHERRQLLKAQVEKFGLLKDMKKLNRQAYYYQAQVKEYKDMLKDPAKAEQKAMAALSKLPAFTVFMKKNSMLAQLFKMPGSYGSAESLTGLQTRASVQNMIQAKFSGSGINPEQYIGQQMQQTQAELAKLKGKINNAEGNNNNIETPDFKPNSQKTKSFLKRIEYGANIQSQRPNSLLPVTTDFALTAGYKLNDKSIAGIGSSFKMGWGNGFKNIKITGQGIGLRSYVDYKLKGGLWISGGYEKNYQSDFTKLDALKRFNAWQSSGLAGLTKKYKIGKKTNKLQLLWDFLSSRQVPHTQPIVFRVGYVF